MKRAQLKSPLGSPAMLQTVRAKQKKGAGGGGAASGSGGSGGRASTGRKAAAKAWEENNNRMSVPIPPMGPGLEADHAEAMVLEARWDREMDELLREGVLRNGAEWEDVSTHMTPHVCSKEEVEKRWHMIKDRHVKGPWAPEEDSLLKILVEEYGSKKWSLIATQFPGRSGKQCRERWLNHLDTRVRKSAWTGGEDVVLCEAQGRLGNKWSEISKLLPGRAENAVKNRFNSIITKRLASQGITIKGSGLIKAKMAKAIANGEDIDVNLFKKEDRARQQQQQQQQRGGKEPSRRQARKKKTPNGFGPMDAYESEWNSSDERDDYDDDDNDVEVFSGHENHRLRLEQQQAAAFSSPSAYHNGIARALPPGGADGAGGYQDGYQDGRRNAADSKTAQKVATATAAAAGMPGVGIVTRGANDVGTTAAAAFSNATAAAAEEGRRTTS